MEHTIPLQNIIENFLEFSRTYNMNITTMLQTYENMNATYNMILSMNGDGDTRRVNVANQSLNEPSFLNNQPLHNTNRSTGLFSHLYNSPVRRNQVYNNTNRRDRPIFSQRLRGLNNRRNNNRTRTRRQRNMNGTATGNPNNRFSTYFTSLFDVISNNRTTATNPLQGFFQPIPILPTQEQITNATEIININDAEIEQLHCPIDLLPFQADEEVIRIRHCNHVFRRNNLMSWFNTSSRCPLCRYDIREYVVTHRVDISNNTVDSSNNTVDMNDENINSGVQSTNQEPELGNGYNTGNGDGNQDEAQQPQSEQQPQVYTSSNIINVTQPYAPDNVTTIQVDTDVMPINMELNNNTVNGLQNELGHIITDTLVQTFQNMLDPSGTNVDLAYNIFNTTRRNNTMN